MSEENTDKVAEIQNTLRAGPEVKSSGVTDTLQMSFLDLARFRNIIRIAIKGKDMQLKLLESKRISKKVWIVLGATCVLYSILFFFMRIFLFSPPEKKLPITENINPSSSLNTKLVYQSNDDVHYAEELIIEGTRAYIIGKDTSAIYILDISNPELPNLLHVYNPNDLYIEDMKAHGNYLFLHTDKLEILDVTNAKTPSIIWQYNTLEPIKNMAISNDYVYLIDIETNLYIIDISTPANPQPIKIIKKFINLDYIEYATTSENLLFVADKGLYIFDISNPTNPIEIGFYGLPLGIDYFDDVVVINKTIWVRGKYRGIFGDPQSHVLLLDISNPTKPTFISTYDHYPFAFFGNTICFYDTSTDGESIHLMNFSNPKKPIELGYIGGVYSSLGYPDAITTNENFAFVYTVNYGDGLNIIKYTLPSP
jgi:hypothetical protein